MLTDVNDTMFLESPLFQVVDDSGASYLVRSSNPGLSVEQLGAMPGTNIDVALAKAINLGGLLLLTKPGTYVQTTSLSFNSNTTLYIGAGVTLDATSMSAPCFTTSSKNNVRLCGDGKIVCAAASVPTFTSVAELEVSVRIENANGVRIFASISGSTGASSANGSGYILTPSGNDQASVLSEAFNDLLASNIAPVLSAGDFIIGSQITVYSPKTLAKWGTKGIGITIRGAGMGLTNLKYVDADSANPAILLACPTSAGIGNRNYAATLEGFSLLSCLANGNEQTAGTIDGSAIEVRAESATGEVQAWMRLRDVAIDGFDYGLSLDDVTMAVLERVWFQEFGYAIRHRYNCDMLYVRDCIFGMEQFGSSYRNSAVAYIDDYDPTYSNGAGEAGPVTFENCWFMKIGDAIRYNRSVSHKPLHVKHCYFEDVRRYFYAEYPSGATNIYATYESCEFSHPDVNDFTSATIGDANYGAKFQFDGTVATGAGHAPFLNLINCNSSGATAKPLNAWVSFVAGSGIVNFDRNTRLTAATTYGHIRSIRTNYESYITLPNSANGSWEISGKESNVNGVAVTGTVREVTATITGGSTYSLNHQTGDKYILTLPDGDCTIDVQAYSATPPSHLAPVGKRFQMLLIVPASIGGTRTITWGTRLKMNAATLQYTATEQNKRAIIDVEVISNSSLTAQLVSAAPVFV